MKIARFAIFLTGIIGLAMGGIMSISSLQNSQEESLLKTNENLKSQAQIFVDQFYIAMESVKHGAEPATFPYVTHKGVVKLNQGVPTEMERLDVLKAEDNASGIVNVDLSLEERLLAALKKQVTIGDIRFNRASIGTFDLSEVGSKEGIFVAIPQTETSVNAAANPTPNKLNLILIDPVKAMASFKKITHEDRHAFLVSRGGRVLAHSLDAFVGTNLMKMDSLRETIDNLFLGAQTGTVGHYQSVDGTREQIAFVRAGTLPFAIAVEQKANFPVLSMGWISEELSSGAARKNLGVIFVMMATALALFSGVSLWLSRELKKQITQGSNLRSERTAEKSSAPALPANGLIMPPSYSTFQASSQAAATPKNIQKATEDFVQARNRSAQEQENFEKQSAELRKPAANSNSKLNREYLKEFSEKAANAYTIETIEQDLAQLSSELAESPILYFRYHRRAQNLMLASVAGEVKVANYQLLQAYVRKDIEQQVERLATEGKVASVTNYGPMAKLMISHLNVAHFEAWAVTCDPEMANGSQMQGVLVVLHAGFRSAQSRPQLAKLLREAGNYIHAQTNKIAPKKTPTASDLNA